MRKVSICVLTYGNYTHLARRALDSIRTNCPRSKYELIVGGNALGSETARYLRRLQQNGEIDHLLLTDVNLSKCPMMREMFHNVRTEFIWWFDDDSYILDNRAFGHWLSAAENAPQETVMWGQMAWCNYA